jgi:hypothetical protein
VSIATVPVYDAIRVNAGQLPPGRAAGYTTGSGTVPWSAAEWAAHPGAVRIDQDPAASDRTADVLDVESGAATISDCPPWCEAAEANWATARRPGQRKPAVYCSASNVTSVVNALGAAGIKSGPGLWVADWNLTQAEAVAIVEAGGGPFPVIGVQYGNRGAYDISVFSVPWLTAVSGDPPAAPQPAPGPDWTETLMQTLPTLSQGATGEDVRTLQGALVARHYTVTVDGAFGAATKTALQAFQSSRGLTADGACGPLTWPKLLGR